MSFEAGSPHRSRVGGCHHKVKAAAAYAVKHYGIEPDKALEFMDREIQWAEIKQFIMLTDRDGKRLSHNVTCEVCGDLDHGGYWCRPCVHRDFCCECCILMGIPEYSCGVFDIDGEGIQGVTVTNKPCGGEKREIIIDKRED